MSTTNSISGNNENLINDIINENVKDTKNIAKDKIENAKDIVNDAKVKVLEKGNEMKTKGLGVWNVLKKAGVMLGTTLGGIAALVATGTIAVTLPVSLPVLGAIAGGLFAGGVIATLVHNVKDPSVKGGLDVFKHTLKDVGSNMLLALPTLLACIHDPEKAKGIVDGTLNKAKEIRNGIQKDLDEIQNIVKDTADKITDNTGKAVDDLQKQVNTLQGQLKDFQEKTENAIKEQTRENLAALNTSKTNVLTSIEKLKNKNNQELSEKLESIREKVENDELSRTFEALNKSFSDKSPKSVQPNQKNIFKENIERNKNDIKIQNEDKEQDLLNISNISDIEKEVEPLLQSGIQFIKDINDDPRPKGPQKAPEVKAEEVRQKQVTKQKGSCVPPKIDAKPIQKGNGNDSLNKISDAFKNVDWNKVSCISDKLKKQNINSIEEFIKTAESDPKDAEKLTNKHLFASSSVQTLCVYNKGNEKLLELKNALENFKVQSQPSVFVNENSFEFDNGYKNFGDLIAGSAI